jgi:uncharacterized protein
MTQMISSEGRDRDPRVFLTARWTDVLLVNYRVPPWFLDPLAPAGSVLNTPDAEPDSHLLSIVALRFRDTRVRGVRLWSAPDFAELNLRFYVRQGDRRAAVFLREFVLAPLIVLGARVFYQQPYFPARVSHTASRKEGLITVRTRFHNRQHQGSIEVVARDEPRIPPESSVEHFLKERYWGFHEDRRGNTFAYRVEHPVWRTYPVERAKVTIDPGELLGGDWRSIDWDRSLHSVVFAAGSEARVFDPVPRRSPAGCRPS